MQVVRRPFDPCEVSTYFQLASRPLSLAEAVKQQTMSVGTKYWDGDEWEKYVLALLRRHYPSGKFQEVPDKHKGDYGLEGFSLDGCAYQCYAAEEPLSTQELHDKQRTKLTRDVRKFVENAAHLKAIFGNLKIEQWILVVPRFESAPLLKHAEKLATQVRSSDLSYAAADFRVIIITDDQFAVERVAILEARLETLRIEPGTVSPDEIEEWADANDRLIQLLDSKLAKLRPQKLIEYRQYVLRDFIAGQNVLNGLLRDYKSIHEEVLRSKADHERFLEAKSLLPMGCPIDMFNTCLGTYRQCLAKSLPGVSDFTIEVLANEAVADWLLRCPLDFLETQ